VRDETIVLFSVYAGLPAKVIGALKMGDVSDEAGAVPEQFNLSAVQSTGGKTRLTLCVPCF
jgi:integrase/recombinase XerD